MLENSVLLHNTPHYYTIDGYMWDHFRRDKPFKKLSGFFDLLEDYLLWYIDVKLFPYATKMLLSANFIQQGKYNRLDIVTSLMFKRFFIGATAVANPAKNNLNSHLLTSINVFTGVQFGNLRAGLSYDLNTSKIGKTDGIYEISLTYQFNLDIKCFGCPNYNERSRNRKTF